MSFIWGLIVGLIIGVNLGLIIGAFIIFAKKNDKF